jgi:hypothetical protein
MEPAQPRSGEDEGSGYERSRRQTGPSWSGGDPRLHDIQGYQSLSLSLGEKTSGTSSFRTSESVVPNP